MGCLPPGSYPSSRRKASAVMLRTIMSIRSIESRVAVHAGYYQSCVGHLMIPHCMCSVNSAKRPKSRHWTRFVCRPTTALLIRAKHSLTDTSSIRHMVGPIICAQPSFESEIDFCISLHPCVAAPRPAPLPHGVLAGRDPPHVCRRCFPFQELAVCLAPWPEVYLGAMARSCRDLP